MSELWKAVVGFEGYYEVSSLGRVRSLDRTGVSGRKRLGRVMTLKRTRGGYLFAAFCVFGKRTQHRVNRLVAKAFSPYETPGSVAAHLNGVRTDNRADNLAWKTKLENEADKIVHGTLLSGSACPWATLTESEVVSMRAANNTGESIASIARRLNRKYQVTYDAVRGRRWAHV